MPRRELEIVGREGARRRSNYCFHRGEARSREDGRGGGLERQFFFFFCF